MSARSLSRSVVTSACLPATLAAMASLIRWANSFMPGRVRASPHGVNGSTGPRSGSGVKKLTPNRSQVAARLELRQREPSGRVRPGLRVGAR